MIFADKLIALRKKAGYSQEELAQQLNVTRQSVSKWEGAQSVPDIEKILQISKLFGVTTDYLLKDEMGEPEYAERWSRLTLPWPRQRSTLPTWRGEPRSVLLHLLCCCFWAKSASIPSLA